LNLFRSEPAAQAFVVDPEQALLDAGLSNVTSAQIQSVAATAIPSLALGAGDPVVGLQRAVSNHYGFEPQAAWAPTWSPQTDLFSGNQTSTDFASHNDTSLLSPNQDAGANAQQGAFNLGFGDITLFGNKTTTTANGDGAVAVNGNSHGDIVSGDGAVLGNANSVNNGNIHSGSGSNVTVGHDNSNSQGNTAAGHDVVSNHDGTVIQTTHGTTDVSQGNTNWTAVGGNQTTTNIDGVGNTSGVDNTHNVDNTHTVVNTHTTTTSVADNSVHDSGNQFSASNSYSANYDASVHDNTASYNSSVHDNVHESQSTYAPTYDSSTHDNTAVQTHQNTHDTHLGF
jgi:hypothetical protein